MTATTELRDMLDAHGIEVTSHRPMKRVVLARENSELRELVRDMLMCLTWTNEPHGYMEDGCNCCRFRGKTNGCGLGMFRGRARELGIEVE